MYPRLWRFALALTRDRAAADDLAQAVALRALDKAAGFTPGTHLDRWLFVMARRMWLNDLRAAHVRRGAGQVALSGIDLPDPAPATETNIFARQVFDQVMALPEAQRETVLLVYVEGMRYREAAQILEIPVGTVMSRLAAARATIKAATASDDRKQGNDRDR